MNSNQGLHSDKDSLRRLKIAVPLFNERIAPHFGASSKVMLVEIKGGSVFQRTVRELGPGGAMDIARQLLNLKVGRLICGGIQRGCKEWLIHKGVSVLDNQKGSVKDLIENLIL